MTAPSSTIVQTPAAAASNTPIAMPLYLRAAGLVTSVGDDAASSCAAMRARLNNHKETQFHCQDWHPIVAARAAIDPALYGEGRLLAMAQAALRGMLQQLDGAALGQAQQCPWLLCTPENSRVGRLEDDTVWMQKLADALGLALPAHSLVLPMGRSAGLAALEVASQLLQQHPLPGVLLIAADSLVDAQTLEDLDFNDRLLTPENPNGFIPGEAAAALWLCRDPAEAGSASMRVHPAAVTATDLDALPPAAKQRKRLPIDGQELAAAMRMACDKAHCRPGDISVRLADANGSPAGFKEQGLAEARVFRPDDDDTAQALPLPALWLPAESLGEVGSAYALAAFIWAWHAAAMGYAPGPCTLVHASNDEGLRAAAVLQWMPAPAASTAVRG